MKHQPATISKFCCLRNRFLVDTHGCISQMLAAARGYKNHTSKPRDFGPVVLTHVHIGSKAVWMCCPLNLDIDAKPAHRYDYQERVCVQDIINSPLEFWALPVNIKRLSKTNIRADAETCGTAKDPDDIRSWPTSFNRRISILRTVFPESPSDTARWSAEWSR